MSMGILVYICTPVYSAQWTESSPSLRLVLYTAGNSVCLLIVQHLTTKDLCPHKICYYPSNK